MFYGWQFNVTTTINYVSLSMYPQSQALCVMYLSNTMRERSMIHISLKKAGLNVAQSQALCVMYLYNTMHEQSMIHISLKKGQV